MPSIIVTKRRMKRIQQMFLQKSSTLHSHTTSSSLIRIFISSLPLLNGPSVGIQTEEAASQAPFFSRCMAMFTVPSSHAPQATLKQGCALTGYWWPREQRAEGLTIHVVMCMQEAWRQRKDTQAGSRWHSPQLLHNLENLQFLISPLTIMTLINQFPWQQL